MYVIFQIEFFECVVKRMEQIYIDTAKMLRAMYMKVLGEAGIVKQKREGKNIYYSLNSEALAAMHQMLGQMFEDKPDCICHQKSCCD